MLAATHVIFGVGLSLLVSQAVAPESALVMTAAGAVGSLLPDIDHPKSTFGRMIWPVSSIIGGIFGHRGITHSFLAVAALLWLFATNHHLPAWAVGLAVGYASHLLADWLTPCGVPLFWPSKKMYRSPRPIPTGGFGESVLSLSLVMVGVLWALR